MTLTAPLDYSAATHPGHKRNNNEDCFVCLPQAGIWAVADGMGGHEAGEVASAIVRETFEKQSGNPNFSLSNTVQKAHQAILSGANKGRGAQGMGSTLVALHSLEASYKIAWVGDSRAYLWSLSPQGGQLSALTTDHSYVQGLYATGAITAQELESHPDKNIITQCLGMQELAEVNVDITEGTWEADQWILLCSDGLSDELSPMDIANILQQHTNLTSAVDALLNAALVKGGHDNITLQLIASPLRGHSSNSTFWRWIPALSRHRTADAVIYLAAIALLLGLLVSTIQ